MASSDIAVKEYLKDRERYADLFNAVLFNGMQFITKEELSETNIESDIIAECEKIVSDRSGMNTKKRIRVVEGEMTTSETAGQRAVWRYRDIVMKWKGIYLVVLACELQDKVHYAMPVRGMLYDALSYTDQMSDIWQGLSKEEQHAVNGAEYFSRFRKSDRLSPVITLVFYYGEEPWDGSLELHSMFGLDEIENAEAVSKLVEKFSSNYKVNLIDISTINDTELFHSDLKEVLGLVRCRNSKEDMIAYAKAHRDFFEHVDYETINVIGKLMHSESYINMFKVKEEREEYDMCKALRDLEESGISKGINIGRSEGFASGIRTGIKKAIALLKECNLSDDMIVSKIMGEFNLTSEEAKTYMQ